MRVGAPLDGNLGPGNSTEHQRTHTNTNQGYGVILCFTRFCAPGSEQQGKPGRTGCFPERDKFPNQQRLERDGKVTETSCVEGANANEMFGHAYGGITPFSPTRGDCTRERERGVMVVEGQTVARGKV